MRSKPSKTIGLKFLAATLSVSSGVCCGADEVPKNQVTPAASSSLYLKVRLDNRARLSKLKAGDRIEGTLVRDVYSSERELFAAGTRLSVDVDHVEKRRRIPNDHWPWIIKAFTPRHESYPVFKSADIVGASGETLLPVSLISASRKREVHAQARKNEAAGGPNSAAVVAGPPAAFDASGKSSEPIMVLEAPNVFLEAPNVDPEKRTSSGVVYPDSPALETIPTGTAFRVLLMGNVSASRSKTGDIVEARLLEPIFLNSRVVLPAGTLFDGRVVKQTPPRWGSRAGTLVLRFSGATLPNGNFLPISASLAGAELDRGSHTRLDAEGQLRGERPGKAWMALNIGMTAGLSKGIDDGTQLIVEALISTATDVSTAGTARIVSSCVSGIFMLTRRGRDVMLPRFTEMNITLDRPLSVRPKTAAMPSATIEPGN